MQQLATITSKRQLTIPVDIFSRAGLEEGQKVLLTEDDGKIQLESATRLVAKLAGSVKNPVRFRGLSSDEIVRRAKKEYFSSK